jgi:hypothetical protein
MMLPGGDRAQVDIEKLRDYCLNHNHQRGRHKARVFSTALNLTQSDAETLRAQLLLAAQTREATPGECDQYGDRYIPDFDCVHSGLSARVRSGWIVLRSEDFPD